MNEMEKSVFALISEYLACDRLATGFFTLNVPGLKPPALNG